MRLWKASMIVAVAVFVSPVHGVPIQWTSQVANGHWYEFINKDPNSIDWQTARTEAQGMQWPEGSGNYGDLATITSQAESDWILGIDNDPVGNVVSPMRASGSTSAGAWVGGLEVNSESNWQWVSGEPWDFTNWNDTYSPPEPRNDPSGLDYVLLQLHPEGYGYWCDSHQTDASTIGYIVEWVPEPTTLSLFALGGLTLLRRKRR